MHPTAKRVLESRWRWTYAGLLGSACSLFLMPFNLAGFGAVEMWTMWLLFPFGMRLRLCPLPMPLEATIWLGPPAIYGLVLSTVTGTRYWRLGCFSILITHAVAVVFAAVS
jgi:hypothetical protein